MPALARLWPARWAVTSTSPIGVRSSPLRSRSVVVCAAHRCGRSRARAARASPAPGRSAGRDGHARASLARSRSRSGALLQKPLEGADDEPVLGLARVELAPRAVGLVLGALEREPLAGQTRLVLVLALADGAGGRGESRRCGGFQEGHGDRLVQPPPAKRLAGATGGLQHMREAETEWPDAAIYLHCCITATRSVTATMQKALAHEEGFAEWYEQVQMGLKADEEMLYLKEARNHVLKRGALRLLHSYEMR